jgi:DNA-binding MarR family transcriptional regulator
VNIDMLIIDDRRTEQLVDALEKLLSELPGVRVHSKSLEARVGRGEVDARLEISVKNKPATLLIERKNSIYPRDVRSSLWHIRHLANQFSESSPTIPVVTAPSISDGAKELLRAEGIGYFEGSGSLFLSGDGIYILLDRPPSKIALKDNRSLFSDRRSQVVLALLSRPNQWFGVKELAEEANVSPATASEALTKLDKFDWVLSRGNGPHKERMLVESRALLDEWAKKVQASPKPHIRRYYVPSLKPEELLSRIDQVCSARMVAYAITAEWAAQLYSPFLSNINQVRCRLPAHLELKELVNEFDAREVSEGSNLGIIETQSHSSFLFRERQRDIWLASPILVYLDLLQGEGRAREMAEHLRSERIKF